MIPLSVVIPSRLRPDLLRACLASVARHAPPGTQVIVVDDASPEGTVTAVAERAGVEVIRLAERTGFCGAVNCGIAAARAPFVEVLNDDTEVCAGWAETALAAFADPSIAAVAPLVLRWPTGDRIDSAGDGYHVGGFARKHGHDRPLSAERLHGRFVFGASGSAAFYRRAVLAEVGGFPESFGAYFEDVDLSFRLHWAGWRVWFEPGSRVLHHVGASHGTRPDAALLAQQSRNEELVFWRNLPLAQLLLALPIHLGVLAAKAWRRWRQGELRPFLRGRLGALLQLPEQMRQRERLPRGGGRHRWHLDSVLPGSTLS